MSDSAFRRLLLDTVATVIVQPPSTTSLIELLRIATPTLLASNDKQRQQSAAIVRDASKRDKLFKTLQLRIHPDKHVGDTRVTELFQEVTLFYDKCVVEMEKEDSRQTQQHDNYSTNTTACASGMKNSGQYHHPTRINNPRRPNNDFASGTTHSDYENYNDDHQQQANYYRHPWYKRNRPNHSSNTTTTRQNKQPLNHACISILSTLLFPPLGICALRHSYEVSNAYNDGRYNDARNHSERAYSYAWLGCLCFIVIFGYLILRNSNEHGGEGGWDWDKMKHDWGWDNGP